MPRHENLTPLDPAIAEDLHRLEAALAGTPDADPTLVALVDAVRADAPPPAATFRAELDARAATGFPRRRPWASTTATAAPTGTPGSAETRRASGIRTTIGSRRTEARFGLPRWVLPAGGALATVGVVAVVAVSALQDRSSALSETVSPQSAIGLAAPSSGTSAGAAGAADDDSAATSTAAESAGGGATTARKSASPADATAAAPPLALTPAGGRERSVERATDLALRTDARSLQRVADGVVRVTQAAGGVVEQSSIDAHTRGGTASFRLAVPTRRADDTLARLSRLAHVSSVQQASTDITAGVVSVGDQLADARAERRALRSALTRATTPASVASLRERLRTTSRAIARLEAHQRELNRRADNTAMTVTVTARGSGSAGGGAGDGGGAWTPGDAAHDALRGLEVAAGVLVIAAAILVPLGLLGVPALVTLRRTRRRRREHALDAA